MLQTLFQFDPISYLEIDTIGLSNEEIIQLYKDLNAKIGEYVLLKLSDQLTEKQIEHINAVDSQQMLELMHSFIPNLTEQLIQQIEAFKKDYKSG